MKQYKILFLLFSLLFSTAVFSADKAKPTKADVTAEMAKALKAAESGPKVESECISCLSPEKRPKAILESKSNKQSIELTVLSEKEVQDIFEEFKKNKSIPFEFPLDGCYARAHTMVQLLEKKGIIAGKGWVEGRLNVSTPEFGPIQWGYHVAPIVMVRVNGKDVPYIIDPSLMNKAVPFEEWKNKMTSSKGSSKSDEYFTSRFNYSPDEKGDKLTAFDKEAIEDASFMNQKYTDMLQMFRQQKTQSFRKNSK